MKRTTLGMMMMAAVAFVPFAAKAETTGDDGIVYGSAKRSNYWLFGVRGGVSMVPGEVNSGGIQDQPGLAVNVSVNRVISGLFYAGGLIEYQMQSMEIRAAVLPIGSFSRMDIGDLHTITLMPTAGIRFPVDGTNILLNCGVGLGININAFNDAAGSPLTLKPNHAVAIRISGGAEYAISDQVGIALDVAYKVNDFSADTNLFYAEDLNVDTVSFLVGTNLTF